MDTMQILWVVILTTVVLIQVHGLDNGVALTPPMGWLSWERFECNTDCENDRDNCISEWLIKTMADYMAEDGYKDVGYEYVAIDDCWLSHERDSQGRLQPDPERFPSGMKALADYVHSKGLKLGIYEDVGIKTCAGFPGCEGHFEKDAKTFADWGVDMLKFDGCNGDLQKYNYGYPAMGQGLNATGRPIVYSCEWPMYAGAHGGKPDYSLIAKTCNMFRDLTDIYDSWDSVLGMIGYFGDDSANQSRVAGPGAWNDPDQIVIGNYGLSHDQERVQMALFAILASPMMVSVDFRTIRSSSKAILQNRGVISISQDPLGVQGKRIKQIDKLSIWTKPILPKGSWAIAFMYTKNKGWPLKVSTLFSDIGLNHSSGYNVTETFDGMAVGVFKPVDTFHCFVNPTGVYIIKAVAL